MSEVANNESPVEDPSVTSTDSMYVSSLAATE